MAICAAMFSWGKSFSWEPAIFFCGTALRTSSPNCSDAGVRLLWPYLLYPSALGHHPYSDAMQALHGRASCVGVRGAGFLLGEANLTNSPGFQFRSGLWMCLGKRIQQLLGPKW